MVEDFQKEQQGWIGKLLAPLNQVFQALSVGLQHGITFQDNIACQVYNLTFNNNVNELSATHPLLIKNTLTTSPIGMWVVNAIDTSTQTAPQALAGAVFPTWVFNAATNQVNISAISGLVSGQQYKITVIII